jgi:hypothetical protein
MDGFMKGSPSGASQQKIHKITEASNLLIPKVPKAASIKLKSAAQGVHKGAQRSQTLMRSAVKKPATIAKSANTQLRRSDIQTKSPHIDTARLNRVQTIDKHNKVRRFGQGVSSPVKTPKQPQKVAVGEVISHQPNTKTSSRTSLIHKPLPSMVTSASHQQLERLLDQALTRADAHKKSRRGRLHNQNILQKLISAPRWLSIGSALVVVVLLAIFVAMNKVPQVAVRVAATKAHIGAQIPGYVPSGFSFTGPVGYSDGKVSIKYKANDGSSREFTVNQASSKMSSKSLEDKVVPEDTQVQTSVVNGTTVYIYGENNDAAWVNNGMQYTVKDSAGLNSDQILKIANSL